MAIPLSIELFSLKRSVGQREECACGGAGQGSLLHIHVPATRVHPCTARNSRLFQELQRRHAPPQACHSRCSVIHP
ncbi:MAG: hypothetical protein P8179_08440 [Candidatus Thiodiazotropha sp.]